MFENYLANLGGVALTRDAGVAHWSQGLTPSSSSRSILYSHTVMYFLYFSIVLAIFQFPLVWNSATILTLVCSTRHSILARDLKQARAHPFSIIVCELSWLVSVMLVSSPCVCKTFVVQWFLPWCAGVSRGWGSQAWAGTFGAIAAVSWGWKWEAWKHTPFPFNATCWKSNKNEHGFF